MARLVLLSDSFRSGLQAAIQSLALCVAVHNMVFNLSDIGRSVLTD